MFNNKLLREILELQRKIWAHLTRAQSATLTFRGEKMSASIAVGGPGAQATFTEYDGPNGTGNKVPPIGPVVFESSDPNVATVDETGKVTAVGAGTCTISALDKGNNLSAGDTLTVTTAPPPPTAQSATLTLQAL